MNVTIVREDEQNTLSSLSVQVKKKKKKQHTTVHWRWQRRIKMSEYFYSSYCNNYLMIVLMRFLHTQTESVSCEK